jgi:2'-5' RNA ligase
MKIKKYTQFLNESVQYKLGCVMMEVPISNWEEITSTINQEDIYEVEGENYGIQSNPHVTILYGLHEGVTLDEVKSVFEGLNESIDIKIEGIGVFENENFDVVKFNVVPSGTLQNLNNKLSEFPNSNEYPEYKPHITLCYVKKGCGKKYEDLTYRHSVENVDEVCYSMPNGSKEYFTI